LHTGARIHMPPSSALQDDKEYVGFATLPNQVHRKSVKKGFDFTLMVAGESGLGKSTLVNSLFLTDMYRDRKLLNAEERITQTVEITKHVVDIEEKGVKLRLTIVDTPGFGEAVNNTECWKPVADYIDQQFEQYFRDESGLNRKNIQDNRVHCCLYFISPFGHGLRPLDVEFMRALHQRVNIVPILAKADTLTPSEVERKKSKIREEIERYGIRIYQFPECDSDEDEDFKLQDQALKESIPFAVIGSNMVVEAKGRRVRGRLYPWGIVEGKAGLTYSSEAQGPCLLHVPAPTPTPRAVVLTDGDCCRSQQAGLWHSHQTDPGQRSQWRCSGAQRCCPASI
uniref:Septin-type G domain-containing protein n=1 Tax=Gopherus evgoodei TaxID=1825980 RepID=A0A8C4WL84_9SAUR